MLNLQNFTVPQIDALDSLTAEYAEKGYYLVETQTDVRVMRKDADPEQPDAASAVYVSMWVDEAGDLQWSDY